MGNFWGQIRMYFSDDDRLSRLVELKGRNHSYPVEPIVFTTCLHCTLSIGAFDIISDLPFKRHGLCLSY